MGHGNRPNPMWFNFATGNILAWAAMDGTSAQGPLVKVSTLRWLFMPRGGHFLAGVVQGCRGTCQGRDRPGGPPRAPQTRSGAEVGAVVRADLLHRQDVCFSAPSAAGGEADR